MKMTIGAYATGDRFWDRGKELKMFSEMIDSGNHILLVAQRRMGKSSLLKEAIERLGGDYICLFVDLQNCSTSADAIAEIGAATYPFSDLWYKTKDAFKNIFDAVAQNVEKVQIPNIGISLRAGMTSGSWENKGNEIFEILASAEKPVVLMLDELPILVNRMLKGEDYKATPEGRRNVDLFMSWLRKMSLHYQDRLRIVISGSIGLEPILHQAGLSAVLNAFSSFELKPWDKPTAIGCIKALAEENNVLFEAGAAEEMVDCLECCIPDHVQVFFGKIKAHTVYSDRREVSAADVQEIYQADMLGVAGLAQLIHYEERLKLVLGPEVFPMAVELLNVAAFEGCLNAAAIAAIGARYEFASKRTQDVLEEALHVLEHDGYLEKAFGKYKFVSKLLRDWWQKRYEAFYQPGA